LFRQTQLVSWQAQDLARHSQAQAEQLQVINDQLQVIKRLNQQCQESNRELEAFCYSVSHDLRSPLRSIASFAQILLQDYGSKLDDEGKRIMGVIQLETGRMGRLVDGLLSFSRLGRQPLRKSVVDVTALVNSVLEKLLAGHAGRKPEVELKALPPAHADEALMRQVFASLLSNAIKFTAHREVPRIEISGQSDSEQTVYYVKDNGVGFEARHANKLFGVFHRLHGQEEFEGAGVGLALVQRIIQRHGGRIWAESVVNEGATFHFALPNEGENHERQSRTGYPAR
jgi:light-regulated signal transduction histidine kinase (bacteriophytochrome)